MIIKAALGKCQIHNSSPAVGREDYRFHSCSPSRAPCQLPHAFWWKKPPMGNGGHECQQRRFERSRSDHKSAEDGAQLVLKYDDDYRLTLKYLPKLPMLLASMTKMSSLWSKWYLTLTALSNLNPLGALTSENCPRKYWIMRFCPTINNFNSNSI